MMESGLKEDYVIPIRRRLPEVKPVEQKPSPHVLTKVRGMKIAYIMGVFTNRKTVTFTK
jgi:hypothetical protein